MKKHYILVALFAFALSSCATDPYTGESRVSRTAIGTGTGALVGAGIGALAGKGKGAAIGAGVGALAGAGVGGYMDYQASELRQELMGTGVQIREANGNIYLIMPGNITFATNSSDINPGFNPVLNSVAKVLTKYNKTIVQVAGYTDSTGSAATNNHLSLMRATSVANYLKVKGVDGGRISAYGYGSAMPIASNNTGEGKEQNRRVEITLQPIAQ